jgi:hypothetical protein
LMDIFPARLKGMTSREARGGRTRERVRQRQR